MKKILLIDDSPIQLRLMRELLKSDYTVMLSTSGPDAMELLKRQLPDLIFLDYDMPDVDGKMTIKMLRENEATKNTPVVFLTGMGDKENMQSVLEYRPSGYLLKPASKKRIFETIHQILKDDIVMNSSDEAEPAEETDSVSETEE